MSPTIACDRDDHRSSPVPLLKLVTHAEFAESSAGVDRDPIVLHVVQSLRGGGAEALVRELVPRLRRREIDARVLCAYGASELTDTEAQAWDKIVYTQERSGIPRLQYLKRMRLLIREISPDIVHTHTHVGATWGRVAAILARVPRIIHTEHGSDNEATSVSDWVATNVLSQRTDATITFSDQTSKVVRGRARIRNVQIIPNGIRIRPMPSEHDRLRARRELDFDNDTVVIGMAANFYKHKNPELAIEAFAMLPSQTKNDVRMALFGDGPMRADLEARAKALKIDSLVRFFGFRADLEQLLPGLDLVLTTSPREMMPISLLEAMNAGLPIIGVPHFGTLDLVSDGDTGIILKSWDPGQMAEAMQWAVMNPEWRAKAGRSAYLRVKENFDIETVADRHAALYRSILS